MAKAEKKTEKPSRYKGFVRNGDVLHGPITVQKRMFAFDGKQRSIISLVLPSGETLEFGVKIDETQVSQYLGELAEGQEQYTKKPKEYR